MKELQLVILGALCPKQNDYNIFFATMRKSGKDNSGEKIYRRITSQEEESLSEKEKERKLILDNHDHLVVDHNINRNMMIFIRGCHKQQHLKTGKSNNTKIYLQSLSMGHLFH